jgi:hypothetical protein
MCIFCNPSISPGIQVVMPTQEASPLETRLEGSVATVNQPGDIGGPFNTRFTQR